MVGRIVIPAFADGMFVLFCLLLFLFYVFIWRSRGWTSGLDAGDLKHGSWLGFCLFLCIVVIVVFSFVVYSLLSNVYYFYSSYSASCGSVLYIWPLYKFSIQGLYFV